MGRLLESLPNLSLARSGLDRRAERRLDPDLVPALLGQVDTRVLPLHGDRVEIVDRSDGPMLALRPPQPSDDAALVLFLGQDAAGTAYLAVALPPVEGDLVGGGTHRGESDGGRSVTRLSTLRQVGADLNDRDATLFATALALANWHAAHTHCPRCGARTEPAQAGWLRRCTSDGTDHYPRTDVAVIMSVIDDQDRILLARGAGWGEGRFSVLAGFLEPGESLTAAVAREVREEVGLEVSDVQYLGDQPWPFPTSLMVGFTARAHDETLRIQESEIAEARWFTREEYREVLASGRVGASTRLSIARRLVERWLGHGLDER